MKEIQLTNGYITMVDDADYAILVQHKWCAFIINRADRSVNVYARRSMTKENNKITILMHRSILSAPDDLYVDHIDGNGLNNCQYNLRLCTPAENQKNRRHQTGGSSIHKGVYWDKGTRKWRSRIEVNAVKIHLGCFVDELMAAKAYNVAAIKYFGMYARLNNV